MWASHLSRTRSHLSQRPWNATSALNELEEALDRLKNTRFVGEIGLDHVFSKHSKEHAVQLRVFTAFLEVCKGTNKVANIHSAGAEEQILSMLQTHEIKHVNMHWLDTADQKKTLKLVAKIVELGYYVSVTPAVATSSNMRELVRMVPLANLLTETDTHPLVKYGEAASAPKMVKIAVEGIARIKKRPVYEMENATARNFARLLG